MRTYPPLLQFWVMDRDRCASGVHRGVRFFGSGLDCERFPRPAHRHKRRRARLSAGRGTAAPKRSRGRAVGRQRLRRAVHRGAAQRLRDARQHLRKGTAIRPLSREQKRANKEKSRVRSRVEHAFGRIAQFGGDCFRRIDQRRCRFETALTNLTYNLDRYAMFHARD